MEAVLDSVETFNNCIFATVNRIPIDYQVYVVRRKQLIPQERKSEIEAPHLL